MGLYYYILRRLKYSGRLSWNVFNYKKLYLYKLYQFIKVETVAPYRE